MGNVRSASAVPVLRRRPRCGRRPGHRGVRGDPRKAVKALLVANGFLEAQFEELRSKVSQATREDDFRQRAIVRSS